MAGKKIEKVVHLVKAPERSEAQIQVQKARESRLLHLVDPVRKGAQTASRTSDSSVEKNKDMAGTTTSMSTLHEPESVQGLYSKGRLVVPPINLLSLSTLHEYSSELSQCLAAMTVNIEGYGHRLVSRVDTKLAPPEMLTKVDEESAELTNFFEYCDVEHGLTSLRLKTRFDIESNGNGYWEIIRDVSGRVAEFKHAPSYMMRLGQIETKPIPVKTPVLLMQPDKSMKIGEVNRFKRFRQYLQLASTGEYTQSGISSNATPKSVWFKEFQDKRIFSNITGCELTDLDEIKKAREAGELANEMIHFSLYCPRSPYGSPRYVGNMLGIYGDRAAEEMNYITFENNNIPSMFVSVTNGQLTPGTINRIDSLVESSIQGNDNYSKFLIIEAEGFVEGEDSGQIKIEIKPLTREQHTDAMFQKYAEMNRDSIRRSFRLPPILVGRAEDYTRATADASVRLADEQIFSPARNVVDEFFNRRVLPELGSIYHKFRSNSPDTTDNTELVSILSTAEKTGGMTPTIARRVISDILGQDLGPVSDKIDGDTPFSLQMAEAVKNQADPAEPGQQLTALKMIGVLTGDSDDESPAVTKAMEGVAMVRATVEKKLRSLATKSVEPHAHN